MEFKDTDLGCAAGKLQQETDLPFSGWNIVLKEG